MKSDFRHTLLAAFQRGIIEPPQKGERWAMFNASPLPIGDAKNDMQEFETIQQALTCEQGFRPIYNELIASGFQTTAQIAANEQFNHSIIFASRSRGANEAAFHRAWSQTQHGGRIVICGNKKAGVDGMRKWLARSFDGIEGFSKNHAICFEIAKTDRENFIESTQNNSKAYGMFSSGKVDDGSRLLTTVLDDRVRGKVADFGAGWGYLSSFVLKNCKKASGIDLYEAEYLALEESKTLLDVEPRIPISYHWIDLTKELKKKPYDTIIMNPPFHHGFYGSRQSDPLLGQAFIQQAASTLVQGGKLIMVANVQLPYEKTLENCFRKFKTVEQKGGYKIFEAMR